MNFLLNAWYQAGWLDEIDSEGKLARRILGESVLLFRSGSGDFAAVADRCLHRFAPLSRGKVENGLVYCRYHGLGFDGAGQCVHNPHGVPLRSKLRTYPVEQRHSALWLWMGDPSLADPALIPDLSFIDERPSGRIHGNVLMKANYLLVTDNILDLSHTATLHPDSIGSIGDVKMTVDDRGDRVAVRWTSEATEPPAAVRVGLPPGLLVDNWTEVVWRAPSIMVLNIGFVPAGSTPQPEDSQIALHNMVPETETTTHYFFMVTRGRDQDNEKITEILKGLFLKAFIEEDLPMIEAQQAVMGTTDLWSLKPVMLPIDKAAALARRKLEKMIADEAGVAVLPKASASCVDTGLPSIPSSAPP